LTVYDVIIVGAGPAGIFAAMELIGAKKDARVLILEKAGILTREYAPPRQKISAA
jgi:Predicted flavoproteins